MSRDILKDSEAAFLSSKQVPYLPCGKNNVRQLRPLLERLYFELKGF